MVANDILPGIELASCPPAGRPTRRRSFVGSSSLESSPGASQSDFAGSSDYTAEGAAASETDGANSSSLPPVDTGYAWIFLACAFTAEFISWGIPYAVGVFHDYWISTLFPNNENQTVLAVTATFMTGFMLMCCMAVSPLYTKYPEHRAKFQYAGVTICSLGLLTSGFATKPWHVLVSIGFVYPFGGALYYLPEAGLLFDWFVRKRGLAAGIAYSSGGVGGAVFPFLIEALYNRFSYKTSMIALGIGFLIPGYISVYYTRERIPVKKRNRSNTLDEDDRPHRQRPSLAFLRRNTFYCFTLATFGFSLGNILPNVYLPTYITTLGLSKTKGTALVAALNAASAAGLFIVGHLTDRFSVRHVTAMVGIGAAIATFFIWGFSENFGLLVAYAIVFGFFGLGFPALWPRMITIIAKNDVSSPPTIISILLFTTGVGNVICGPVADALLASKGFEHARFAYGIEGYGPLLVWIGGVFALGSLAGACYVDKGGNRWRSASLAVH